MTVSHAPNHSYTQKDHGRDQHKTQHHPQPSHPQHVKTPCPVPTHHHPKPVHHHKPVEHHHPKPTPSHTTHHPKPPCPKPTHPPVHHRPPHFPPVCDHHVVCSPCGFVHSGQQTCTPKPTHHPKPTPTPTHHRPTPVVIVHKTTHTTHTPIKKVLIVPAKPTQTFVVQPVAQTYVPPGPQLASTGASQVSLLIMLSILLLAVGLTAVKLVPARARRHH